MNIIDYLQQKIANPNFDEENTFMVPLDKLEISEHEESNEVRTHLESSDRQLELEIKESGGNEVPITVHGGPDLFNSDDGHRRVRALKAAGFKYAKAIMGEYNSKSDRLWSMLGDNFYDSFKAGTLEDIVNTMLTDIKKNLSLGSDFSVIDKELIESHLIENFTRKKLHKKTINAVVNKVYSRIDTGVRKYTKYANKSDAAKKFTDINPWGLKIHESGTRAMDKNGDYWTVYMAGSVHWVVQNAVMLAWNKKDENPDMKVMLVGYDESANKDLDTFRSAQIKNAKRVNDSELWAVGVNLFDAFVHLPQVLQGESPEDHNCLINLWGEEDEKV